MTSAYVCHHNTFLVYDSLDGASYPKFSKVTHSAVSSSAILMLVLGLGGYGTFGEAVTGNVLDNFSANDTVVNIARFFYACTVVLTYPIELFVAREVVENYFFPEKVGHLSLRLHVGITLALSLFAYLISIATEDLGFILGLNGALCASCVAYVLPGLCFIKLDNMRNKELFTKTKIPCIALIIFGLFCMILGTIVTIRDTIEEG
eukprot:UC4_evm1s858